MKAFRVPRVHSNERVVPKDFNRLAEWVLDICAQYMQHVFANPAADGSGWGIVLWGLRVESAAVPNVNPRQIKVKKGAALLPPSATSVFGARPDVNDPSLDTAAWRLIVNEADLLIDLDDLPHNRTDTIGLILSELGDGPEPREFRTVGAGGEAVENRPGTITYRLQSAAISVAKSGNGVAAAGAVRLANVPIDNAGALGAIIDLRTFMWPMTAGAVGDDSGGGPNGTDPHGRGFRRWLNRARLRLDSVIDAGAAGGLKAAVKVALGGPDVLFDDDAGGNPMMDLQARRALGTGKWRAGRVRVGGQEDEAAGASAAHYINDPDGLAINAATVPRASLNLHVEYNPGDNAYVRATWAGQNVIEVRRWAIGAYDIDIDPDAVTGLFGNEPDLQDARRWRVVCSPSPHDALDVAAQMPLDPEYIHYPRAVVPQWVGNGSTLRIRLWGYKPDFDIDPPNGPNIGQYQARDFPFSVAIYGPLGAELNDLDEVVNNA